MPASKKQPLQVFLDTLDGMIQESVPLAVQAVELAKARVKNLGQGGQGFGEAPVKRRGRPKKVVGEGAEG